MVPTSRINRWGFVLIMILCIVILLYNCYVISIINITIGIFFVVDNVYAVPIKKSVPEQVTCIDGTVNFEPNSGMVTYDDTHEVTCKFGRSKCYKQTMNLMMGQWPSKNAQYFC